MAASYLIDNSTSSFQSLGKFDHILDFFNSSFEKYLKSVDHVSVRGTPLIYKAQIGVVALSLGNSFACPIYFSF